jgi:hypothetical protein
VLASTGPDPEALSGIGQAHAAAIALKQLFPEPVLRV